MAIYVSLNPDKFPQYALGIPTLSVVDDDLTAIAYQFCTSGLCIRTCRLATLEQVSNPGSASKVLGPVAPISVNFNHQLTQHHRHDNSNSRATSANSSSVKWVSQLS